MPATTQPQSVSAEAMQGVFDEVKTPFKFGVVLKGEENKAVDCPSVFRFNDKWYMLYVCMNKVGYETHLARSEDLLKWEPMGKVLSFREDGWDKWQCDGGIALVDHNWPGTHEPAMFDGRYWMSYIGGAIQGYETDPLSIGVAWTKTPDRAEEWTRVQTIRCSGRAIPMRAISKNRRFIKVRSFTTKPKRSAIPLSCFTTPSSRENSEPSGSGWPSRRTWCTGRATAAGR
jgi:hypothetical protein